MSNKKTWFITGAGRGMGLDFAKAALEAGHAVVATGRDPDAVAKAIGKSNDLLTVKLDVTSRADAEAAVQAALDRFGGIDVLVNNAASFYAGYFEELTPEQFESDRSDERYSRGPSGDAQAALGSHYFNLVVSRPGRRLRVRERVCRVQVRSRRLDGIAPGRGRALRHQHHHC
ncbi:MAG TPA: SDR family NAD(P)-dependent oxidoreductase [Chthoniobacterales bacterium]